MNRALLLFVLMVMGCSEPTHDTPADDMTLLPKQLTPCGILVGAWQNVRDSSGSTYHEHWECGTDGAVQGTSFVMTGNDTIRIEYLSVEATEKGMRFSARVGSVLSDTVSLYRTVGPEGLVFERSGIQFPDRIAYVRTAPDTLRMQISGLVDGQEVFIEHRYTPLSNGTSAPE